MARTHGGDKDDWTETEEALAEEAEEESTSSGSDDEAHQGGGRRDRGRRPLAEQVAEYDLQARMADTLDRIAASLDKIANLLGRPGEQRRQGGPPQQGFRGRPGGEGEFRRDYGNRRDDRSGDNRGNRYPEGRSDRYQDGRRGPGRPGGRRWGRDSDKSRSPGAPALLLGARGWPASVTADVIRRVASRRTSSRLLARVGIG